MTIDILKVKLGCPTDPQWTATVLDGFDLFLLDHAACERKASALAVSLVCHYPDKPRLVSSMTDLAIEELAHFREVMKHVLARRLTFKGDEKDAYVNQLARLGRRGTPHYLLDRLLIAGLIEARGLERFGLLAEALSDATLVDFYQRIAASEARHATLFTGLAEHYAGTADAKTRLEQLQDDEVQIIQALPLRPALH